MESPKQLVANRESWSEDDWWLLEAAAFRNNGSVLRELAGNMPMRLWSVALPNSGGKLFTFVNGLMIFVLLVSSYLLMPLLSVRSIVLAARGFEVPVVAWHLGAAAAVALVPLLYFAVRALASVRAALEQKGVTVPAVLVLVSSAIQLVVGVVAWPDSGTVGSPLWFVASIAAALGAGFALLVRRSGSTAAAARTGSAVDSLDEATRAAVRESLDGALDQLATDGLITPETRDDAKALPLGQLGAMLGSDRPRPAPGDEQRPAGAL